MRVDFVGNRVHLDARERRLPAPVGGVGGERDLHPLRARDERIGAAADRMAVEADIARLLHDRLGHDRELGELREQYRVGGPGRDRHLVLAGDLGAGDLIELAELRALERRVGDPANAEHHIGGGQLRAVLKTDAAADLEDDLGIGLVGPRRRHLRHDAPRGVAGDKVVEDVAVDRIAVGVPLHLRVERSRIARQIDHEQVLVCKSGGHGRREREQQGAKTVQ